MKEIRYDGDLYRNICEEKEKNGVYYGCLFSLIIIGMVGIFFGKSFLIPVVGFLGTVLQLEHREDVRTKNKIKKAIYKMKKDADIEVSCDELQKAKIVASKTEMKYDFDEQKIKKSKEEKIVKYFEFLDKQDQIQILKQVKTVIGKQNIDNELYLLEDEDLEKEGIQYIKR